MSSAITLRSRSDSGTSPETIRWARPSTIAVLPTPGSPISTGLFFVRRESTWITRRISSSRPITGSSLPSSAARVRSLPNLRRATRTAPRRSRSSRGASRGSARPPRRSPSCVAPLERSDLAGGRVVAGEREQQVLRGDELVAHLARLVLGGAQDGEDVGIGRRLGDGARASAARRARRRRRRRRTRRCGRGSGARARRRRAAARASRWIGVDLRVLALGGERDRGLDGLAGLLCESVELHGFKDLSRGD